MKKPFLLAATLIFSSLCAHAGNMFGPAPFRNGSPLVTGVDGTYQATARAENVTGIFRFAYSGGSQTLTPAQNYWIFFINGLVCKGSVTANINDSQIDGVLDPESALSALSGLTGANATTITLPYTEIINTSNSSTGSFSGKLNLKNSNGAFNGNGIITGAPTTTKFILGVSEDIATGNVTVSNNSTTIPGGDAPTVNFKFRGVRTSTSVNAGSTSN